MQKAKVYVTITENLNNLLQKSLDNFSKNTEWTDIHSWLNSLEALLKENPSPFFNQKILLSKRLNQCMNPILPDKVHQSVLKIHETLFNNMRQAAEGNINEYINLFAKDLGIYSISLLSYFAHSSVTEYRRFCLRLIKDYYIDLGKQLIPMLLGFMKAILPVYGIANDHHLVFEIESVLDQLLQNAGRKYVIGAIWSCILRFNDCRISGLKYLAKIVDKMQDQNYSQSIGLSEEEERLKRQLQPSRITQKSKRRKISVDLAPSSQKVQKRPSIDDIQSSPNVGNQGEKSEQKLNKTPQNHSIQGSPQIKENDIMVSDNLPHKLNRFNTLQPIIVQEQKASRIKKLDKVPLMITQGIQSIKQGIDTDAPQNNYPNLNTLVVNAIVSCLEDQLPIVRRSGLDFMLSHLHLKSQILSQNDKKVLIQGAIRLFRRKQVSITKKVNRWLFGKQDQENTYPITSHNQFIVPFLIESFERILSIKPTDLEDCSFPIKVLQNFYIEHPDKVSLTLSKISLSLLRYIFNFGGGFQFSNEVLKAGKRFLQNFPSNYPIFLKSFGSIFKESIQDDNDHQCFQVINYLDFCYKQLMYHEHGVQQLQEITIVMEDIAQGLKMLSQKQVFYRNYLKETILLTYNLISRRDSVLKFMRNKREKLSKQFMQQSGLEQLPKQQVQHQQRIFKFPELQQQRYALIFQNLQLFFIKLGSIIKTTPNIIIYQDSFKLCALSIIKLLQHLPKKQINTLPKWFGTLENGIRVSNPTISLAAIQSMIKCLLWENKHPIYSSFKNLILIEQSKKVGNDYQKLALEKLWSLLDFPHMHSKIVDLIVAFSKYFPNKFTDTVKRSFSTHNAPQKQASIQRFSHFWRLTGFKYKDLLLSNRQFVQLNKTGLFVMLDFLDDQNPLVRHAAKNWLYESMALFHRILQPLFDELIKGCQDWYVTPKGLSLIKSIYDTKMIFDTFRRLRSLLSTSTYPFLRYIYQTQISDRIEQLRPHITEISTCIISDQQKKQEILEIVSNRQPVLPKIIQKQLEKQKQVPKKKMKYLDILIIIAVKYIEGHALQSMGVEFYLGNSGVNASAIQLIDAMLNYSQNPQRCFLIINYIINPLFKVFSQVVANQQYVTQIQIINLLTNIIFSSSFRQRGALQDVRNFYKNIFLHPLFISSLLRGLNTPFSYVRTQIINFITRCIKLIADFLQPEDCTRVIKNILVTYYKIIKQIKINLIGEVLQDQQNRDNQASQPEGINRIKEMEMKAIQQQKIVKLTDNLQQVAKTNQILSVLHGVSAILNYFYDLETLDIKSLNFQFTNPYTFMDTFKTIITLGFGSSEKDAKLVSRKNFLHNFDTCQSILKDLSPVYETILRAWPLSEEFVRIATQEFSAIGMKTFNFQRFSRYNKILKDLIQYVQQSNNSIWSRIYAIMQPMFYKFPTQITDIYLQLWVRECPDIRQDGKITADNQKTQFLMKIVQTIIVNNFPINVMIHAFLQTSTVQNLKLYYQKKNKESKKGIVLDYKYNATQAKVLYFLYVYFNYVHLEEKEFTKDTLLAVWSYIMKAIKPFLDSDTPTTVMWILQILNICSRKYSPKELLTNEKFKHDLHAIIKDKIKFIASIASQKILVFYDQPVRIQSQSSKQSFYKMILPLPPCFYSKFKGKHQENNQTDRMIFVPVRKGDYNEIDKRTRIMCFKLLKNLGLQLLQNTYLPEKNQWIITRTCQWVEMILPSIEDKNQNNMLFAQSASQVLYDLFDRARIMFIKPLRTPILNIFNKDDFFICNFNTLNYWSKIIDWIVSIDKSHETFMEYLDKVTLSSSFFKSQSIQNKKRIKSFERICFILYSGCQDKYLIKIKGLLQKISQVIRKAEESHPSLLILILFSIRILILRLSQISLNQLFIDVWPMLLALLMQLFTKQFVKVSITNQISRNPNLLIAALKLIEMISLSNLSTFAHHQWIFIFDYFGIKLSVPEMPELQDYKAKRPQMQQQLPIYKMLQDPPFIYKPYLTNYLPTYTINYIPKKNQRKIDCQPIKRKIVITDSFVSDQNQVKVRAYALAQYLVNINQLRTFISPQDIEMVIVNDFINLDSFIHKIV